VDISSANYRTEKRRSGFSVFLQRECRVYKGLEMQGVSGYLGCIYREGVCCLLCDRMFYFRREGGYRGWGLIWWENRGR